MNFDGIAPHYRWLEGLTAGALLQRCRTAFLDQIREARNLLLLGEGRGRFLSELATQNPDVRITVVDASARMLEFAQSALGRSAGSNRLRPSSSSSGASRNFPGTGAPVIDRVRFVQADLREEDWPLATGAYDAIASHFFLDCFPPDQLPHICRRVSAAAAPHASWLISDFCVPNRGWQRLRARGILAVMYAFFRIATHLPAKALTRPDAHLQTAGFRLSRRRRFNHGLLHSDVWLRI